MKLLISLISLSMVLNLSFGQVQSGHWRTDKGNSNYHHFTRTGGGAAVYINQEAGSTYPILRLSSGSFGVNTNVRFTVENNGAVGIGTMAPDALLTVAGNWHKAINFGNQSNDDAGRIHSTYEMFSPYLNFVEYDDPFVFNFLQTKEGDNVKMGFHKGNVGIGTVVPSRTLEVAGSSKWTGNEASYTEVNSNSSGQYLRQFSNDGTTQSWLIRGYGGNGVQAEFNDGGIKVNGVIKCKEVKVTTSDWPDYVFTENYRQMPLKELEAYIHANGHLPRIPTEKEVMENGIDLGEMNTKLLEKVEELTMYIIQQDKMMIEIMDFRIAESKRLNEQQKRIEALERKIAKVQMKQKGED
ncbi:hypothetical protein [Echinicola strongylocentroti]|nr:hypothetical protein [Echinicola strongylocentroti]